MAGNISAQQGWARFLCPRGAVRFTFEGVGKTKDVLPALRPLSAQQAQEYATRTRRKGGWCEVRTLPAAPASEIDREAEPSASKAAMAILNHALPDPGMRFAPSGRCLIDASAPGVPELYASDE